MRFQIDCDSQTNLDKLEEILNSRSVHKRLSWLDFPNSGTPFTDIISVKYVLCRAVGFLFFITGYFVIFGFLLVTLTAFAVLVHFHHRIHHLHWQLVKLLYQAAFDIFFKHDPPSDYVTYIVAMGGCGLIFFFGLRGAWNRRADRLSREGSLPLPDVPVAPGVWPPPPTVSAGDLPKA